MCLCVVRSHFFFFNDTATTEIYTLSLHDALPISLCRIRPFRQCGRGGAFSSPQYRLSLWLSESGNPLDGQRSFDCLRASAQDRDLGRRHGFKLGWLQEANRSCRGLWLKRRSHLKKDGNAPRSSCERSRGNLRSKKETARRIRCLFSVKGFRRFRPYHHSRISRPKFQL